MRRLVVRSAVGVIDGGALVGLGLAMAVTRLLAAMLFAVQPLDAIMFASVAALEVTAALSIAAPAWRATRIDAARALRSE